jgi:WhiB family redox-sensing transcriptional regulator
VRRRQGGVNVWKVDSLTRGRRSVNENTAGTSRRASVPSQYDERRARRALACGSDQPTCVGPQAGLFFSDDGPEIENAKRLCASCPQRGCCLAGALERGEPWGGLGWRAVPGRSGRLAQATPRQAAQAPLAKHSVGLDPAVSARAGRGAGPERTLPSPRLVWRERAWTFHRSSSLSSP